MTPPDLRVLAQQGNPDPIALRSRQRIASWLNQRLQPRGVTVRILVQANLLKILLVANRPLNQQAFVNWLQHQLQDLALPHLDRVKVYCQDAETKRPLWTAEFVLAPQASRSDALSADAFSADAFSANALSEAIVSSAAEPAANQDISAVRSSRQELPVAALFPLREIFRREVYQRPIVRLLLFLVLVPLTVNLLAVHVGFVQIAWLTGTYYAVLWSLLLYFLIKPTGISWIWAIGSALFTALVGIPILLIVQHLPPFSFLYAATSQGLTGRLLGFVLGVGLLEEFCKALPLLLLLRFRRLTDLQTIAFYGAISGLGFAVSESGVYALQYAIAISRGRLDLGLYLTAHTIRFVSLPLFHAVLSGIMGYFMGLALRFPRRRYDLLIWGLAIVATLHGLYNAFSGGLPGTLIIGLSLLLFVVYLDRTPKILQWLEAASTHSQRNSHQSKSRRQG